jgi:hypothetical protein
MPEYSFVSELRSKILNLFDSYTWGDDTLLNQLSILKFLQNNAFDHYWINCGIPSNLTSLIRNKG